VRGAHLPAFRLCSVIVVIVDIIARTIVASYVQQKRAIVADAG
jgi:hypothetical protein